MKGDVWADRVMAECKATQGKSISLKLSWLEKLVKEAFATRRDPALVITFEAMKFGARDWAVIPLDRYQELLELERGG